MANVCVCNQTLGDTGTPKCPSVKEILKQPIYVNELNSVGAPNSLDIDTQINKLTLQSKFDEVNVIDRFYPFPILEDVTNLREDPVFQEFASGKKSFVREGDKNFLGMISNADNAFVDPLQSFGCSQGGWYYLDKPGNFVFIQQPGNNSDAFPILMDSDTYYAGYIEGTDEANAMIGLQWQWDPSMLDKNLRFIPAADLDFSFRDIYGLLDVTCVFVSASAATGEAIIDLHLNYGVPELPAAGILPASFGVTFDNITQASAVTILGVVESVAPSPSRPYARYTISWTPGATVLATDEIQLNLLAQVRFDLQGVRDKIITVAV